MDVEDALRQQEYECANSSYALTDRGVQFLLENAVTVLRRHGKTQIAGLTIDFWYNSFKARIGIEPLFRLLWVIIRDLQAESVQLHQVLVADPMLFLDCLQNDNLLPYYERYPQ